MERKWRWFGAALVTLGLQSCGGGGGGGPEPALPTDGQVTTSVLLWNRVVAQAIDGSATFDIGRLPHVYAYAAVAAHDAVNSVERRYETYLGGLPRDDEADARAAIARATRDVLLALLPADGDAIVEDAYDDAIAGIADSDAREAGIDLGEAVAERLLAERGTDLTDATPYVVTSATQFRAPVPYGAVSVDAALATAAFATDYQEVVCLGRAASIVVAGCADRTTEQTEIGHFWAEDSSVAWNRIARTLVEQENAGGWEAARALALMHIALVDVSLTTSESKALYDFPRPQAAIAGAAGDGNAATVPVPGWLPVRTTPTNSEYPSAHAANGRAAQVALAEVFGNDDAFTTTSTSIAGNVERDFANLGAAASENAESRVFIGFHFRGSTEAGEAQGTQVGGFVVQEALREVP